MEYLRSDKPDFSPTMPDGNVLYVPCFVTLSDADDFLENLHKTRKPIGDRINLTFRTIKQTSA